MAVILKSMTFSATRREWKHRIFSIQSLDRGLLIDTKNGRMLRRMQIQTDDIGRLGFKIRIVGSHVAFEPMRSQSMLSPHAGNHHVRDVQLGPQFARAPVRRPITGLTLHAPLQDARLQSRRQRGSSLPSMTTEEPCQSLLHKTLAPAIYKAIGAVEFVADQGPCLPRIQQQNQSRATCLVGPTGLAADSLSQFRTFHFRQTDRVAHASKYTIVSVVTVH